MRRGNRMNRDGSEAGERDELAFKSHDRSTKCLLGTVEGSAQNSQLGLGRRDVPRTTCRCGNVGNPFISQASAFSPKSRSFQWAAVRHQGAQVKLKGQRTIISNSCMVFNTTSLKKLLCASQTQAGQDKTTPTRQAELHSPEAPKPFWPRTLQTRLRELPSKYSPGVWGG